MTGGLATAADMSSRERVQLAKMAVDRLGLEAPELAPYQEEPPQMPSGVVGKYGFLHLGFEADGRRTILSEMDRRVPFLVQKGLYWDEGLPDMPCVMIITTTGCVVQGDRMALQIRVGKNARAHVTTQSATKVHMMSSNYAAQLQEITVEDGGYLEYLPDPVIPHRTARFLTDTRISIAETGSLIYSEILLPGRKYHHESELFGFDLYSSSIRAVRPPAEGKEATDGRARPLFIEKFILDPHADDLRRTGGMNGFEVFGNVILLGPSDKVLALRDAVGADVRGDLAFGCSLLPGDCGLVFKVLGMNTESVQAKIREFWGMGRRALTGSELPPEFLWR